MIRLLPAMLILLGACSEKHDGDYFATVGGGILSVETGSADAAAKVMAEVQATLQSHPEWRGQTLSHGAEPPSGYFYKFKGRCATMPAAAVEVRSLLSRMGRGPVRCQDVGS